MELNQDINILNEIGCGQHHPHD